MNAGLESRNPHDNSLIGTYPVHGDKQVDAILDAVSTAQQEWRRQPSPVRARLLDLVARSLRESLELHAQLITREMGKPIRQARAEVEKCAWLCDYYAAHAPGLLADTAVETGARRAAVVFNPLGVVLAIMPWNFPYWQAFRFAIPALAAGNAVVLKHASNVSGCAMAIEQLLKECLPENLLRTLLVRSDRMAGIIADRRIQAVTFTGSTEAGRKVGAAAGNALKKSVLELGGSDACIVLADADIEAAAETCAAARLVNSGQSCIAAKRFIVVESIHDRFVEAFSVALQARRVGDPLLDSTDIGPLARPDLAAELQVQVERSLAEGARLAFGAGRGGEPGAYYPTTLLLDVEPGMTAASEELFGPVAAVLPARSTAHAVELANDSVFGLGGAIFTADVEGGWQLARDALDCGIVAINSQVVSDPRLPFGGIRDSGYGRELGEFGIREFVNVKSVTLA